MANLKQLSEDDRGHIIKGDSHRYLKGLDSPNNSDLCEAKVSIVHVYDNGCVVKIDEVGVNKKTYPLIEGHEIVALWSELWI